MDRTTSQNLHDGGTDINSAKTVPRSFPSPYSHHARPDDFHDSQEDLASCPNTPSMTRGSSRSTSSSVVVCDGCECLCQDPCDPERLRLQHSDKEYTRSPLPISACPQRLLPDPRDLGACNAASRTSRTSFSSSPIHRFRSSTPSETSSLVNQAGERPGLIKSTIQRRSIPEMYIDQSVHDCNGSDCDTSGSGDDEDDDTSEAEDDDWSGQDDNLEAIVLNAVGGDLELAAYMIPLLHKSCYSELAATAKQKVGPWRQGLIAKSATVTDGASSSQTPSSTTRSNDTGANSRKRQRTYESSSRKQRADDGDGNDEDEEDDNNGDSRGIGEPGDKDSPEQIPRLACPFHKKNPTKFCIQHVKVVNSKTPDYRSCAGPGFKSIQRLKEHIKRKHYPVQCDRCYETFPGSDRAACVRALESHRQLLSSCERGDSTLKEGISDAQCVDLDKKKSVKRNQESSRVEKYMEIWDILFPGSPRPTSPWYDGQSLSRHSVSPSQQSLRFSELFRPMLELQVNQQYICFPPGLEGVMRARVESLAVKAFNAFVGVHGLSSSTNSSSSRSFQHSSLLGGSYEQLSTPLTAERQHSSTPSRSSASKSQAYSMNMHSSPTPNPTMIDARRHRIMPPPNYGTHQIPLQDFDPSAMAGVQNQHVAQQSGFAVGIQTSISAFPNDPFNSGTLNPAGSGWYMNFDDTDAQFSGPNATAGFDHLSGGTMSQGTPPGAQGMPGWDQVQDPRRTNYDRS